MHGCIHRAISVSFCCVGLRHIHSHHQQHPSTMNLLTHNLLCCPLAAAAQKLPLVIEATEVTTKERDFNLDFLKKCEALPPTNRSIRQPPSQPPASLGESTGPLCFRLPPPCLKRVRCAVSIEFDNTWICAAHPACPQRAFHPPHASNVTPRCNCQQVCLQPRRRLTSATKNP